MFVAFMLIRSTSPSGVAQLAERSAVNRIVVGSIPTPGAKKNGSHPRVWPVYVLAAPSADRVPAGP
jgi:hypothetical protein